MAHRLLEKEGHTLTLTPLRKSTIKSSSRHANNIKNRKLAEVDTVSIKSSLHDLFQAGRLRRPVNVCEVILDDNSSAYKKVKFWNF